MVRSVTGLIRVNLRNNFAWFTDLLARFGFKLPSPWLRACCSAGFVQIDSGELDKLFGYLRFCLEQVCADMEMESLLKALDGDMFSPAPVVIRPQSRCSPQWQEHPCPGSPGHSHPCCRCCRQGCGH